jgi:hypothetical protein
MPDYSKGKIYLITDDKGCYVGSTTQSLKRRYQKHSTDINYNKRKCSSSKIINKWKSKIILLEEYPCESRQELLKKEREWMDKIKCVNKERPFITQEERKEYQDNYRKENKKELNEYRKNWRKFKSSWGYNNYLGTSLNLLDIDTTLFQ